LGVDSEDGSAAGGVGDCEVGVAVAVGVVAVCAPPELESTTPLPRSTFDSDGDLSSVPLDGVPDGDESVEDAEPDENVGVGSVVGAVVAAGASADSFSALPAAVPSAEPDPGDTEAPPASDGAFGESARATSWPVAIAAPIPNATASPQTRTTYTAEFVISAQLPLTMRFSRRPPSRSGTLAVVC